MDTTELVATIVELTVPLVAGVGLFFLRHLSTWLKSKSSESALYMYLGNLSREVEDYIDDAATISVGELREFRRPESAGGERITDEELNQYASAIARKILVEGAGESWLQRGAEALGVGVQSPEMESKLTRAVKRTIRAREDHAAVMARAEPVHPPVGA